MKCTIPGANMKVLARAIQALGRIGDELYVEPTIDSLSFRSVNSSNSAYASFTFNRPFFSFYKYIQSEDSQSSQGSSKCKISMKSCVPVFRSPVMLDRKVENCIMYYETDSSKLVFQMKCRYGITKTFYLPIIESGILQVVYTRTPEMNILNAPYQVFTDSVHNFLNTQEEITLDVTPDKIFIRSYADNTLKGSKIKTTEISLNISEFNKYYVKSADTITFSLKEFRALLSFAEATGLDIEACFGAKGKPINFTVSNEKTYEADFILSTLAPELESRTTTPQQLRVHNSNSAPFISGGSSAAKDSVSRANPRPSTSRQSKANSTPVSNGPIQNLIPEVGTNRSRVPLEQAESPDLICLNRKPSPRTHVIPNPTVCSNTPQQEQQQKQHSHSVRTVSPSVPSAKRGRSITSKPAIYTSPDATPDFLLSASQQELSSSIMRMDSPDLSAANGMNSVSLEIGLTDESDLLSPHQLFKRRRLQLFNNTLDVNKIPGHDVILVSDSEEEEPNK